MEVYINQYLDANIIYNIYEYIGWYNLRMNNDVPDWIWKKVCDRFCQNISFKNKFDIFWETDKNLFSYRDQFIFFINSTMPYDNRDLFRSKDTLLCDRNCILLYLTSARVEQTLLKPRIFEYINPLYRGDREIVLAAVKISGSEFKYADPIYRSDREIVLNAVKNHADALKYADEVFKDDREIVFEAVKNNACIFEFASTACKCDREFIMKLIKLNVSVIEYADESIKNDYEIGLLAVGHRGTVISCLSHSLQLNRDIVLTAVNQSGGAFSVLQHIWRRDVEIILIAVRKDASSFQYIDPILQNDKKFVMDLMDVQVNIIKWLPNNLKSDKELVAKAISKGTSEIFLCINIEFLNDAEFMLSMLQYNAFTYQYLSTALKQDKNFMLKAKRYRKSFWGYN